jgi:hypothetical protein
MTSEEIKKRIGPVVEFHTESGLMLREVAFWTSEVAYQLAVMNENGLKEPIAVYTEGE